MLQAEIIFNFKEIMDAFKFLSTRFVLLASIILMLQGQEVESQKSKVVVMPMPVLSSQYFVILQVAEEMASRGHMVRLWIQLCYLLCNTHT